MVQGKKRRHWDKFILGIVLPTILAIILSIGSIYLIILPAFQESFLESKKEMIEELTNVAWNILLFYEEEVQSNQLSTEVAKTRAIEEIRHLRYGNQNKDYFFILDMAPKMVMHPYSPELEGQDLTKYRDPENVPIFVEMKNLVEKQDSGYLNYTWQTKYDEHQPVPKLSYVKKFEKWQWIVGTGVFLDDVEVKTEQITNRMLSMVFANLLFFSILLVFIALQSFKIEKIRREAEENLRLSKQKYKALAESATDPMVMVHDNRLIYINKSMRSLLGYSLDEMKLLPPFSLFPQNCSGTESGLDLFNQAIQGNIPEQSHEGLLLSKDNSMINVLFSFSLMKLGDQEATVMVAKDVRASQQIFDQKEETEDYYHYLTRQLDIGLLRIGAEENLPIIDANETAQLLLNLPKKKQNNFLVDFLVDKNELGELQQRLRSDEIIKDKTIQLRSRKSKQTRLFSLSLVGIRNRLEEMMYYDALLIETTEKKKADQERENLIVELQTSLLFLNQPIKFSLKNIVSCELNTSIAQATRIMAKARQSSILVRSKTGEMLGIITDMVLRERVLAENLSYDTPVYKVMSSPLIYIDDSALIFEAVLLMQEKGIKHLVVKNSSGETVSVISNEELLHVHRYSTAFMLSQIREAKTFEEILAPQTKVPRIVKSLTDSGAHAKNITRIITTISDAILDKIIEFTIQELGEPPKHFAFISLGSEGRGEQTLVTDQDNAIIFEDVEEEELEAVTAYFNEFGKRVCNRLDTAGYDFCQGEIMAMNPKWCQPLSVWKDYFSKWVNEGNPQDLLEVSIFFDFRCVYGERLYTAELRKHIKTLVHSRAAFLQHLSHTALSFRPPLDFFGNIQAEDEKKPNSFDIKKAISGVVGFARLYAVKNALESVNTIQRIEELHKRGAINTATFEEINEAYDYLMKLRFRHQVSRIDEGKKPDNFIGIDTLSHMDKIMLKKAFSQITSIQKNLSYDFSGVA